jgi:aldehyde dehydrogenase (NAD+)
MSETVASTRTAASIIAGEVRTGAPGGRLESVNPADRSELVAEILLTDADGFVDAARAARAAQRGWAAVPAPVRGRVIAQVGRLVEANKEALARIVTREIGKPYAEALGEVQEIIDTCDFFLGEGRRLYGQTVPSEMPDKQLFTFRMPVGVAAIVTAGNFPVAVPSWYLVPAILCGNAVVWKPAEYAAATGTALAQLFHAGGVPADVLELVTRTGRRRSRAWSARWRSGSSTRSASPAHPRWARRSARCAAATCSRRAWSSAARTRWW